MFTLILVAHAFTVLALAVMAFYLRRSVHYGDSRQRQVAELQQQIAELQLQSEALRREARERELALHEEVGGLRQMLEAMEKLEAGHAGEGEQLVLLRQEVAGLRTEVGQVRDEAAQTAARLAEQVSGQASDQRAATAALEARLGELSQISRRVDELPATLRATLSRPAPSPIPGQMLAERSDRELIAMAESLAVLRPLLPYPHWRFDADLYNPDLAFQLRRAIWEVLHDRASTAELLIPWHNGTRLCLAIANDIASQIFVAGCLDPNEFAFLDRILKPGMTFLDIGANEGVYAVFAAAKVGPHGVVWAFEPSARELARLRRNVELNRMQVALFPVALADEAGEAELLVAAADHAGQNTLGELVYESGSVGRERVRTERLDTWLEDHPLERLDVMKVDVEGAELRVFRGAVDTLRRYRPVLVFEVLDASLRYQAASREELMAFLREQGYELYVFQATTGLPAVPGDRGYSDNMIAMPAERPLPAEACQYL